MSLKRFKYLKEGQTTATDRVVYVVHTGGNMLSIDLTEFSEEDRAVLDKKITELSNAFSDGIADLGLKYNYRQFKQACIQNDSD